MRRVRERGQRQLGGWGQDRAQLPAQETDSLEPEGDKIRLENLDKLFSIGQIAPYFRLTETVLLKAATGVEFGRLRWFRAVSKGTCSAAHLQ